MYFLQGSGWWLFEYCHGQHVLQYHNVSMFNCKTELYIEVWYNKIEGRELLMVFIFS